MKQDESVTTIVIIVQDMVFLSGLSPGAAERQGICQAGGKSTTLQLEMDHIMIRLVSVASCRMVGP